MPKWFHRPLPAPLGDWMYDGISPFITQAIKVHGYDMEFPLVGRGGENPLKMDPFGAGMRISTRYAYLGGKVCATITLPKPTSGTIFGMYLIDYHPKGSERNQAKWREADLEWLGVKPSQVATSVFEEGQERPNAQEHDLTALLSGSSQTDPVRYCIEWDLQTPKKVVRFWARSNKHQTWLLMRKWEPSSPEVAAFWNEPLRAIFTFWSNRHIVGWSGAYSMPAGEMIWADLRDVTFVPKGPPFCPKDDNDLQPNTE